MNRRPALVIEGDSATRDDVYAILAESGFEVVVETDGRAGLDRYGRGSFSLVVVAAELRAMSGLDVLREIVRIAAHARVRPRVVVTTTNRFLEKSAMSAGASVVFHRPFTRSSFAMALRGLGVPELAVR